jgi:predicted Zn-dependent peptidase
MDLETVAIKVSFATGSRDETADTFGITHFCEHMLCKGTPKFPTRKELRDFLENMGGASNASTSGSSLRFYGRIIAENINVLLEVFADQLKNSLFDAEKIEIERSVILDELRRAQSNNQRKNVDFIETNLFGFSAYRTLGTVENIKSFTRNQMIDWLKKRLSAKNCTICVSGRIDDATELLQRIEDLFNFLPTHDVSKNTELNYTPCTEFLSEPSIKNVCVDVLFPYIRADTYENLRINMAEGKFRKYLSQELGEVLRQQNGLVYGLGMTSFGNEFDGVRGIHTETSPENLEKAIALMSQTAYRIYNIDKITQPVIDRFRNIHRLMDADFLESAVRRCDVLIGHWVDFGKLYDYDNTIKIDKEITADEVINSATGFFDGTMSIMTFGAEHNVDTEKIWKDNFK